MTYAEISLLSCLSLRDEKWFSGWALVHALPNHAVTEGEPPIDVEETVAFLVEKGFMEIRPTRRVEGLSPKRDVDWRNLLYRITDEGRIALNDAFH